MFSIVLRPLRRTPSYKYSKIEVDDALELAPHLPHNLQKRPPSAPLHRPKLPFRRIFTRNVLCTFLAHGLFHLHMASFNVLWFLFLSTPRFDPSQPRPRTHTSQHLPFSFTGGLGLPPRDVGFAIGILGAMGLVMQFGVYSRVTDRVGLVSAFRYALSVFPVTYLLVAYLAVIPTTSPPPHKADGPWIWIAITCLLFIQVCGRTFSLPITQILVNNSTPHPSVLGTIHGISTTVGSGCRTLGPVIWSAIYGWGLKKGIVGTAWWMLSIEAIVAFGASHLLYEGSGHEIRLDGDP